MAIRGGRSGHGELSSGDLYGGETVRREVEAVKASSSAMAPLSSGEVGKMVKMPRMNTKRWWSGCGVSLHVQRKK